MFSEEVSGSGGFGSISRALERLKPKISSLREDIGMHPPALVRVLLVVLGLSTTSGASQQQCSVHLNWALCSSRDTHPLLWEVVCQCAPGNFPLLWAAL